MTNRMKEAALAILKLNIKVRQLGRNDECQFELEVMRLPKDPDVCHEVECALLALSSYTPALHTGILPSPNGDTQRVFANMANAYIQRGMFGEPVTIDLSHDDIAKAPIGALARLLADNDINFPGSARFKSKEIAV